MVKKTETKKETGKQKDAPAKKTRKTQVKPKTDNVVKDDAKVTEDAIDEIIEHQEELVIDLNEKTEDEISSYEEEEGSVEEEIVQKEEPVTELETTTEDVVEQKVDKQEGELEPTNEKVVEDVSAEKMIEQEENVETTLVDETEKHDAGQEKNKVSQATSPRNISGANEEFVTEDSGNEIEAGNITEKPVKKSESNEKQKKSRIIRYLNYLWNGVEVDY